MCFCSVKIVAAWSPSVVFGCAVGDGESSVATTMEGVRKRVLIRDVAFVSLMFRKG